jgi:hypothetical protein
MARKATPAEAEVALMQAMQIQGIDLEPTPDEVEFFLHVEANEEDSTVVADSAESLARLEKTYAAFVAMNRTNASNQFAKETAEEIERKRNEVLARLKQRHRNSEA